MQEDMFDKLKESTRSFSRFYEEDGKWYFPAFDTIFGPYKTEEEAMQVYQEIIDRKNCPSCED